MSALWKTSNLYIVNVADHHSPLNILPSLFLEMYSAIVPAWQAIPRSLAMLMFGPPRARPSLPLALQDGPPVVRPRQESPLGGAGGKMLVVAGGEQDVLPRRFGLHA